MNSEFKGKRMRLEPTPKPDHALRVSARLVTSSTILHLSADELENAVTQEQIENPALEVREQRVCLYCGALIQGAQCVSCGNFSQSGEAPFSTGETGNGEENLAEPLWGQRGEERSYDVDGYS